MDLWPTQGDEKRLLFSNDCRWRHRPPLCHLDRSAAQWRDLRFSGPFWGMFSTERNPDFLLRTADKGLCVPFSLRKPHGVDQSHGSRQEIQQRAPAGSAVSARLATPLKPNAITAPGVVFLGMATRDSFKGFSILVPPMHYGRILP